MAHIRCDVTSVPGSFCSSKNAVHGASWQGACDSEMMALGAQCVSGMRQAISKWNNFYFYFYYYCPR